MFDRFAKALRVAVRDEGFVQILGAGFLLVAVGTITYTTSQDWSLVDGFSSGCQSYLSRLSYRARPYPC